MININKSFLAMVFIIALQVFNVQNTLAKQVNAPVENITHSVYNLFCEQEVNPVGITTLQPRFSWQTYAQEKNYEQSAWQILVSDSPEKLQSDNGNIWDSGKVSSSSSVFVPFQGKELKAGEKYYWKVRTWDKNGSLSPYSMVNSFSMGLLTVKDWNGAQWIALEKDKKDEILTIGLHAIPSLIDSHFPNGRKTGMYHMPQFRKEFTVKKDIKRAVAYVSGLGQFDLFMNGSKVSNDFLDPGWTKYDKLALYMSFDISKLLQQGKNAVGVMLGNGFFNIPRERYFKLLASYGAPRLIMKIQIDYTDGTQQIVTTGSDWKVTESPVTYSSIYGGEDYDATKEQEGWTKPNFDDHSWQKALRTGWTTKLVSQRSEPLKVRETLMPVRIYKNIKGNWVYDFGQNFSGIIHLTVKGNKSQAIKFIPGELINKDSTVYQGSSGWPYILSYTAKGNGIEDWQPQFSYYGFRYAEVYGAVPAGQPNPQGLPEVVELKGLHTCNSAAEAGDFHCSKPLFNQIFSLIDWAIRSNMSSVLTDCPHREKLGWLEQNHLMQNSMMYRYNLDRLYAKIMGDIQSTQDSDGMVPTIAPEIVHFEGGFRDTPEWGSTFIISPWNIYQWYGDSRLVENYYPDMQRYIDYLSSKAKNHIVAYGLGDWLDIGPSEPGYSQLTSNGVTATAIYYYNVTIMEKIAKLLGKTDDAKKYEDLASEIKTAFNKTFWNPTTKQYDRNSQTANAIALYMGLTTEDNEAQVYKNLVDDIRKHDNSLTTGEVGYSYMLRELDMHHNSDIIYDMNSRYDRMGYGWQLAQGATALTESWQAYRFLSNNHLCLGHLMEWFYGGLAGIRQADNSIGFKHIVIKPNIVGDVHSAEASYHSPYGNIVSEWKDNDQSFTLNVQIPANSDASIYLPTTDVNKITEGGIPVKVLYNGSVQNEANYTIVKIGSGSYSFKIDK